jgi:porphyrinogen peroxidase
MRARCNSSAGARAAQLPCRFGRLVRMPYFQPGIFAQGTRFHHHLELSVPAGARVEDVAAGVRGLREPAVTAGGANIVIGFGAELWRRIAPGDAPPSLRPFTPVEGAEHRAPATQHDVWIWMHGAGPDVVLDTARAAAASFAGVATLQVDQPCFVYRDSRDLTGFVDGTENPPVGEAPSVVVIPDGEPGAGGSLAMTQRFVHDLERFHALPVEEQERAIGRTKPDSVELDAGAKPPTAHIARVVVEDAAGEELELFRRSTPFGDVGEHGLFFVAFSRELDRIELMLRRMFGLAGDGLHDRLMDFTRATTGSFWFVPSLESLDARFHNAG